MLNNPLLKFDLYGLSAEDDNGLYDFYVYDVHEYYDNYYSEHSEKSFDWNPIHMLGAAIEFIAENFLPVGIQDPFTMIGRGMKGEGFYWKSSFSNEHSNNHVHGTGIDIAGITLGFVNGIGTSLLDFYAHMSRFSNDFGGANVWGTYNGTGGILTDLFECILQILHIPTNSVAREVSKLHCAISRLKPGEKHIEGAFSQGAIILKEAIKQLSDTEREKLVAVTFGPGAIISAEEFGLAGAYNFMNPYDGVSFIACCITSTGTMVESLLYGHENVVSPDPKGIPGIDHAFNNATYQEARMNASNIIRSKYGQ